MKYIYLIRHAKSSWDNFDLDDFDRPLNDRGKRDAPRMGKRLQEKRLVADLLLSSPAKRAFSTAKRIAEKLDYPKELIKTDERIYHASPSTLIRVIHELNNNHDTILLFGHNPGLTELANELMSERTLIDNIPTCGIVASSFQVNDWKEIREGKGQLLFFDYPKSRDN